MKHNIIGKQHNSKKCLVCGVDNDLGLRASFYVLDNHDLLAIFRPLEEHQSYPGRLHGGISAAILDETIGRAINLTDETVWGVTVELSLRYKKPVPLDEELRVVGRITKDAKRIFEGAGELLLANGEVAATAAGKYLKMPLDQITDGRFRDDDWFVIQNEDDPKYVEL